MSRFDPLCNGGRATIQRRCLINANIRANVIKHPNYYQHVDKVVGKVMFQNKYAVPTKKYCDPGII